MPITNEGLQVGLTAGVRVYDLKELGWITSAEPGSRYKDTLFIVCSSETDMMKGNPDEPRFASDNGILSEGTHGEDAYFGTLGLSEEGTQSIYGKIFTEPEIVVGTPNKVKSYLSGSCVLPIGKTGTVQTILFALGCSVDVAPDMAGDSIFSFVANGWGEGNRVLNEDTIPTVITGSASALGDMFMGIQVSPGIPVTAGGFLTIKGYDGTNENSKSFTYVTLESSV